MRKVLHVYKFLSLMSIDVAFGAMASAAFFANMMRVTLRPAGLAALGVSVWIIYSADHLLDAYQMKHQASTDRHRFHQENFRAISLAVIIATLVNLILIYYIRRPVQLWGMGLGLLVLLYLFLHRFISPAKEVLVAFLYSGGVLLPALSLHNDPLNGIEILLMISFTITALINLVLFSWYEWDHDKHNSFRSLATLLGKSVTQNLMKYLFVIQVIIFGIVLVNWRSPRELSIIMLMNLILWTLYRFPIRFLRDDNYRLLGDFIFLVPLLYLIWA